MSKNKFQQWWCKFHRKHLEKRKLCFASWLHAKRPGKYCWADCVTWAMASQRMNPFKIDNAEGCKRESMDHEHKMCYCGGWMNGKCYDLMSREEQQKLKHETDLPVEEKIPF